MNKTVLADKTLQGIDIKYVEEALEPSSAPEASSVRQFVRKPVFQFAVTLLVCLIAGGVFATVYFHHFKETPTEGTPTQMAEENTAPKQYLVRLISEGNAGEKTIHMESDLSYGSFASKTEEISNYYGIYTIVVVISWIFPYSTVQPSRTG